jgi:hypothetical protein
MNYIDLSDSNTPLIAIITLHDVTGASADADSLPTVTLFTGDNAAVTESQLGILVTEPETGVVLVEGDATDIISNGHFMTKFWGWLTAVMGGITQKIPIAPFAFVPRRSGGLVVADGGNTDTTFKVSEVGAGALQDTTDDAKNTLIVFSSGALNGQVRKIDTYNTATQFLTVTEAFTAAPSSGDAYFLINY